MTQHSQVHDSQILTDAEVGGRMMLLAELKAALEARGIRCVLARNQKLVLRYSNGPYGPSGLTDPRLYILLSPTRAVHATTDGTTYRLDTGGEFPAADPDAAAARIRDRKDHDA